MQTVMSSSTERSSTEVSEKAKRRRFGAEYKQRILREAEACKRNVSTQMRQRAREFYVGRGCRRSTPGLATRTPGMWVTGVVLGLGAGVQSDASSAPRALMIRSAVMGMSSGSIGLMATLSGGMRTRGRPRTKRSG